MRGKTTDEESGPVPPSTASNAAVGRVSVPPTNAHGTLATASGQNSRERKCPARMNWTLAIVATITLSNSAVGRTTADGMPRSVITAM